MLDILAQQRKFKREYLTPEIDIKPEYKDAYKLYMEFEGYDPTNAYLPSWKWNRRDQLRAGFGGREKHNRSQLYNHKTAEGRNLNIKT